EMIGATLYLAGKEKSTGEIVENAMPCSMCKRMIINAGINDVYIRDDKNKFRHYMVSEWIENDDSLGMKEDY
ncbi:MAG: cytidine deaminase, partial [Clostridia bacterium]|nr:cytidine deaminase [Clostridia bacterium]